MCYTLNNGSCLRSGQAVASRAAARQGGCAAGFFQSWGKRTSRVEERPCERDCLTAQRNKARDVLVLLAQSPGKPEPSCIGCGRLGPSLGRHAALHFSSGCKESTGPAVSTVLWGHFPPMLVKHDRMEQSSTGVMAPLTWDCLCAHSPAEPGHGPWNPLGRTHLHWRSGTATNPLPWQTALKAITLAGYI